MAAFTGSTLDEALTRACRELRARVLELSYEVVEEGPRGVTVEGRLDPGAVLGLFLAEVFGAGALEMRAHLAPAGETLAVDIEGGDTELLTAREGEGLDSLQYLCNRVLDNRLGEHPPVRLDCGEFKLRRARSLEARALKAAAEAHERQRAVTLPPMTPAARREVHLALADDARVETVSDGDGFVKRVVVRPRHGR